MDLKSQPGMMCTMPFQLEGLLATREAPLGDHCPISRSLDVVGTRTAMLLVREAFYGASRFDDLVQRVGVTEAVAAQRLRQLVEAGVLAKEAYREPGQRTRQRYVLTEAGHDLLPIVVAFLDWGNRHTPAPTAARPELSHAGCGESVRAVVRCAGGHDVPEEDVVVTAPRRAR